MKYVVSACLAGKNCRWDGSSRTNHDIEELVAYGDAVCVCPEQLGGLPTPREPAGIYQGTGENVLEGSASVRTVNKGKDVTAYFLRGAEEVLKIAQTYSIKEAILKQGSPSCGCGLTYLLDNKLENHKVPGNGVTAALLKKNGINVISDDNYELGQSSLIKEQQQA